MSAAWRLGWEMRMYLSVGQPERRDLVVERTEEDVWSWGLEFGVGRSAEEKRIKGAESVKALTLVAAVQASRVAAWLIRIVLLV